MIFYLYIPLLIYGIFYLILSCRILSYLCPPVFITYLNVFCINVSYGIPLRLHALS